MYHLATISPVVKKVRIPFTRDQVLLLVLAFNELMLGVETYIAHLISGTIVPYEWIPIIFGPVSCVLLLLAGFLALRRRALATVIATLVFIVSIAVGLLGAYFHLVRAILPNAPLGDMVSVALLVWAPPILGPLTFALVGLMGISAAWIEDPPDSGILTLLAGKKIHLPYSKTRALFFMISLGSLATVISSVLDHARTDFTNPWLWLPTSVGIFSVVVAVAVGAVRQPGRGDLIVYVFAMILMILVGVVGIVLHINQNLIAEGTIVGERFLRGAPFLAPLLFSDMGMLGLVVLLNPVESPAPAEDDT
jgi:hypothetical protein